MTYEPGHNLWCAYYADLSGMVVFEGELPALRYAVTNAMLVRQITFGVDLIEQLKNKTPPGPEGPPNE